MTAGTTGNSRARVSGVRMSAPSTLAKRSIDTATSGLSRLKSRTYPSTWAIDRSTLDLGLRLRGVFSVNQVGSSGAVP